MDHLGEKMADSGPPGPNQYQFDDLTVDTGKRLVLRDTSALEISGLTYDLLLAIVQAAPNIIGADELVEKVWSGRATSPETITQRAMMLRQGLGDSADSPRYIEVVRGQGFRLIPALKSQQQAKPIASKRTAISIGAAAAVIIVVALVWNGNSPSPNGVALDSDPVQATEARSASLQRFEMKVEIEQPLGGTSMSAELALSPDGSQLAYTIYDQERSVSMLYLRDLDQFDARFVHGSENARRPVFSPDGQWIAYSGPNNTGLVKVSVDGGSPHKLTDISGRNFGNSWGDDGYIVYSNSGNNSGDSSFLARVPEAGGEPEILIPKTDGLSFVWPESLPGGRHVLFTVYDNDQPASTGSVGILSLETLEYEILVKNAFRVTYLPSGHLLFGRGAELWGVRFDALEAEILGAPVPIVSGIQFNNDVADLAYAVSKNGMLSYVRGTDVAATNQQHLYWIDRNGAKTPLGIGGQSIRNPKLSPDGSTVAYAILDTNYDVWTANIDTKRRVRITNSTATELASSWSVDGQTLAYLKIEENNSIYAVRKDSSGEHQRVIGFDNGPFAATTDENFSLIEVSTDTMKFIAFAYDGQIIKQGVLRHDNDSIGAVLSPNRQWFAYESDETGREEIYVRPYPEIDDELHPISIEGGFSPVWNEDGTRLFFMTTDTIWEVEVQTAGEFSAGEPVIVASDEFIDQGRGRAYDVSADGERFLVILAEAPGDDSSGDASIAFINNWDSELESAQPTAK